jgi:hypothetical protein
MYIARLLSRQVPSGLFFFLEKLIGFPRGTCPICDIIDTRPGMRVRK